MRLTLVLLCVLSCGAKKTSIDLAAIQAAEQALAVRVAELDRREAERIAAEKAALEAGTVARPKIVVRQQVEKAPDAEKQAKLEAEQQRIDEGWAALEAERAELEAERKRLEEERRQRDPDVTDAPAPADPLAALPVDVRAVLARHLDVTNTWPLARAQSYHATMEVLDLIGQDQFDGTASVGAHANRTACAIA
jgi:hypothetical protein